MAHLIDMSNGRSNVAFVGETPWHGLGQQLTAGADLQVWLKEAGLNFNALKSVVQFQNQAGALLQVADSAVIYRDDTMAPLGVVGSGYKVVQPSDVLELFRDLTEKYGYQLETAGSLKGGRIVWALARGDEAAIIGDSAERDTVGDYLLCSTSFDGSRSTVTRKTRVRVVCNNTLTAAESAKGGHRVTHKSQWNAADAKRSLGVGEFARFADTANMLAEKRVEPAQVVPMLLQAYHGLTVADANQAERDAAAGNRKAQNTVNAVQETLTRLSGILQTAPGAQMKSSVNTAWGVVNAVTYDVDHSKPARSQENRLNSAWFGEGDKLKSRVWDAAVATLDGSELLQGLLQRAA